MAPGALVGGVATMTSTACPADWCYREDSATTRCGVRYGAIVMHSSFKASLIVGLVAGLAGCGGSNVTGPSGPPTLAISGTATVAAVGQTSQLTLTATSSQSAAEDVTSQATWTSSDSGIATVNAAGAVTAVSYGSTTIKAAYQGASTQTTFAVSVAGTWSASIDANQQVIWTLSQTGGNVTGTVGFNPPAPSGVAFSVLSVNGPVSGTTFTWTMTLTPSLDTNKPECVGQATIVTGTAQITSGTTMNLTLTGVTAPCDSKEPGAQLTTGAAITFTKQ